MGEKPNEPDKIWKQIAELRRDLTMEQRKNRLRYKKQSRIFEEQINELKLATNFLITNSETNKEVLRDSFQAIINAINKNTGIGLLASELEDILKKLDSKTEKKDYEKNLCQHQRPNKRIGWECVHPESENYKKECVLQRCPHKEDPLITIIKHKASGDEKDYCRHGTHPDLHCMECINEASGGDKSRSLKTRTAGRGKASLNESGGDVGSNPTENSKLPEQYLQGFESEVIKILKEQGKITEPEKYPKVVYQLGSDSKEYIELKKKYDKLIEDILNDWYELDNELTLEGKVRVQREKIEKYKGI